MFERDYRNFLMRNQRSVRNKEEETKIKYGTGILIAKQCQQMLHTLKYENHGKEPSPPTGGRSNCSDNFS